MIRGSIRLEDIVITFRLIEGNQIDYTIEDIPSGEYEHFVVPQHKFFKALAIAVHNDGEPDYVKDYPDAESIMGKIRWIP